MDDTNIQRHADCPDEEREQERRLCQWDAMRNVSHPGVKYCNVMTATGFNGYLRD